VRLPNILAFNPTPFDPETFEDELIDEEGQPKPSTANVIRWRDGGAGDARLSNARLVRWSDGSMTLHVGQEVLAAQQIPVPEGTTQLYLRHKGSNLECHGLLEKKIAFQPASVESKTHRALARNIAQQHVGKDRKIKMTATLNDPAKKKQQDETAWEESNRLQARQAARRQRTDEHGQELTADFLDADDDIEEGNLGAIRQQYKNRKRKSSIGGGGGGGGSRPRRASFGRQKKPRRRRSSDSEDDDDDDDDDESDEEDEGEPGEMDGFIVDDSGDEDSD